MINPNASKEQSEAERQQEISALDTLVKELEIFQKKYFSEKKEVYSNQKVDFDNPDLCLPRIVMVLIFLMQTMESLAENKLSFGEKASLFRYLTTHAQNGKTGLLAIEKIITSLQLSSDTIEFCQILAHFYKNLPEIDFQYKWAPAAQGSEMRKVLDKFSQLCQESLAIEITEKIDLSIAPETISEAVVSEPLYLEFCSRKTNSKTQSDVKNRIDYLTKRRMLLLTEQSLNQSTLLTVSNLINTYTVALEAASATDNVSIEKLTDIKQATLEKFQALCAETEIQFSSTKEKIGIREDLKYQPSYTKKEFELQLETLYQQECNKLDRTVSGTAISLLLRGEISAENLAKIIEIIQKNIEIIGHIKSHQELLSRAQEYKQRRVSLLANCSVIEKRLSDFNNDLKFKTLSAQTKENINELAGDLAESPEDLQSAFDKIFYNYYSEYIWNYPEKTNLIANFQTKIAKVLAVIPKSKEEIDTDPNLKISLKKIKAAYEKAGLAFDPIKFEEFLAQPDFENLIASLDKILNNHFEARDLLTSTLSSLPWYFTFVSLLGGVKEKFSSSDFSAQVIFFEEEIATLQSMLDVKKMIDQFYELKITDAVSKNELEVKKNVLSNLVAHLRQKMLLLLEDKKPNKVTPLLLEKVKTLMDECLQEIQTITETISSASKGKKTLFEELKDEFKQTLGSITFFHKPKKSAAHETPPANIPSPPLPSSAENITSSFSSVKK